MSILIAVVLAVFMLAKSYLFFRLFELFKLRARTSFLATMSLSNYSEFGLIVGAIGVANGWMSGEWLVTIALALSITFTISSIVNTRAHSLFARYETRLLRFERKERLPDDRPIEVGDAQILVFGMGRVGTGVYDTLLKQYGENLLGIDYDIDVVRKHQLEGRNVIIGDATDIDFWERLRPGTVKLILLDMPNIREALATMRIIKRTPYSGLIAASAKHDDCIPTLKEAGVHSVFNIYAEAGSGFASHVCDDLNFSLESANNQA
jgi:voltage-gated potassium channel Kch